MDWLSLEEVVELHRRVLARTGGSPGVRDRAGLESAVAQPRASFGGELLYPTLVEQAAALGHALIANHPFVDGNKRIGHAAMNVTLLLGGLDIEAGVDEQERVVLAVASSQWDRKELTEWLAEHVVSARSLGEESE